MTPTWIALYEAIRQGWLTNGYCPSQSELQRAVGCSGASVQNANRELKAAGYITRQKHEARSSRPTDMDARLYRSAPPKQRPKPSNPWDSLADVEPWETNSGGSR
jgi:DNA-binding transcriptional MocR family regulator